MHIIFNVLPARSHLNPTLSTAHELKRRGHRITYVTSKGLEPVIRENGFDILTDNIKPVDSLDDLFPERAALPEREKGTFDVTEFFGRYAPVKTYEILSPLVERDRPDLIVRDQFAFGGYLVGEKYGIPHAAINITAGWPRSQDFLNGALTEPLNDLRAQHGLSPDPDLKTIFRYLRLDTAPPSLIPEGLPIIPTERSFNQFATGENGSEEPLPVWVSQMPHEKTVLVTLGTVWNNSNELYEQIIRAIQDEDVNVIVATGRNTKNPLVGDFPANVRVVDYVPFTALLPHLDAVVFHGGFISLLTMMWAGIPVVVIPIAADHFVNAEVIAEVGVGIGIGMEQRSEDRIREALRAVLDDPNYRERARRVQADMKSQLSVPQACDLLEQIAQTRQPVSVS